VLFITITNLYSTGLILLQQPGVQRLRETHQDQIKKLEAMCRQKSIEMQVIYDQEEKGDRQDRRERLAALFREAFRLFDEDNEQFGLFKLLSIGQEDDDSDEIPLQKTNKKKKKVTEEQKEEDVTQVVIHKPYEILKVVEKGIKNVDASKEIECLTLCPSPGSKK